MEQSYRKGSLSLPGAVAMGTGVMIGAGIFALTGQVAELSGRLFPLAFLLAAIISGFSAYSYVRMASAYPSAGGIAMFLEKAYGKGVMTGGCALLMALSMVINESLVARTFGTYTLQALGLEGGGALVPLLAVGLVVFAFLVNLAGNKVVEPISQLTAFLKIGGILIFAGAALWAAGFALPLAEAPGPGEARGAGGFLAGAALAVLAYKGFTTITNSGGELKDPSRNVGRAIVISLSICLVVYLLVAFAVGANLSLEEIVAARDYALAEAARPALGNYGLWFTVAIAIIATASGIIASVFAVSRMLTMLTEMKLIPHSHFGMTGPLHRHLLVYTVVMAGLLAAFFDLGRIASLGAVFYLVMDMAIHWGVWRYLREDVGARGWVPLTAIALDAAVLMALLWIKAGSDPTILAVSLGGIALVFLLEWVYLRRRPAGG